MSSPAEAMLTLATQGVEWFPQQYADAFNITKAIVALVASVLLLLHMDYAWKHEALTRARRWRYIALLLGAMTLTYSSAEQASQDAVVNYRNIGGAVFAAAVLLAAILSTRESRRP